MKHSLSICIDEEIALGIFEKMRVKKFQSKSHLIECALREYLKNGK